MTAQVEIGPRLLDELTALAVRAAAAVMAVTRDALSSHSKPDGSPVTQADEKSESLILDGIKALLPGLPVVSEESAADRAPPTAGETFALIDPLDGTRELLAGRDEFTINIAIVEAGHPRLGIIAAPALGELWRGIVGRGAEKLGVGAESSPPSARGHPIATRTAPTELLALVSRSHPDPQTKAYLARRNVMRQLACGSALKFCRLAEGAADIYPRFAPTSEWDVAAGQALLQAAGGAVSRTDGRPLTYGHPGFLVPGFIAIGDPRQVIP